MRLKLIDIIIPGNLFLHFIETVALLEWNKWALNKAWALNLSKNSSIYNLMHFEWLIDEWLIERST